MDVNYNYYCCCYCCCCFYENAHLIKRWLFNYLQSIHVHFIRKKKPVHTFLTFIFWFQLKMIHAQCCSCCCCYTSSFCYSCCCCCCCYYCCRLYVIDIFLFCQLFWGVQNWFSMDGQKKGLVADFFFFFCLTNIKIFYLTRDNYICIDISVGL